MSGPNRKDDFDQWNINAPKTNENVPVAHEGIRGEKENPLKNELSGWGVEVPNVIGEGDGGVVFPDVIQSKAPSMESEESKQVPQAIETNHDEDALSASVEMPGVIGEKAVDPIAPKTEQFQEETKTDVNLGTLGMKSDEQLLEKIEGEGLPEDFWAVDEEEKDKDQKIGDSLKIESPSLSGQTTNDEEIALRVKDLLAPMMEELVKQYCHKNVEKVAWEVIPDLAENIIKKEIENISESSHK